MEDKTISRNKLYLLLPLRSLLFVASFWAISVFAGKPIEDLSRWWSLFVIIINFVCIAILLTKGSYKEFINYENGKTKVKSAVLVVVLTLVIGMGGMYMAGFVCYGKLPYFDVHMVGALPIAVAAICAALLPITTTLAEDGIYLGSINKADGDFGVTLTSAFFYAAQHSFIPFLPSITFMLYRFISFLPLTLLFCFWYRKIRNPLPFMIGHFIINLSTAAMLVMSAVSPNVFSEM